VPSVLSNWSGTAHRRTASALAAVEAVVCAQSDTEPIEIALFLTELFRLVGSATLGPAAPQPQRQAKERKKNSGMWNE
jgi:hypothetical protein